MRQNCGVRRCKEIISNPKHPYTQLLLQSVLPARIDKKFDIADYESLREPHTGGCHFYEYCSKACEQCKTAIPELNMCNNREVACFLTK
ncbi:MAG: oligopeptide/dipeptide ABC transporter ATP-binding protein [Acutalibacteraceae bacterium]